MAMIKKETEPLMEYWEISSEMSLNYSGIRKLFKKHFKGKNPLQIPVSEREKTGEMIRKRLKGLKHIRTDQHYYVRKEEQERTVCNFSVEEPSERYYSYSHTEFDLLLNEQNELTIRHYRDDALISDLEEIFRFVSDCQEEVERRHAMAVRRKKVREFKAQAIIARVKQMAKEEKFDFYTETDTVKLKLYVRLSDKDCIELHIPFSKFQEVLPNVRETVSLIRKLHGKGIHFKFRAVHPYHIGKGNWITHDTSET